MKPYIKHYNTTTNHYKCKISKLIHYGLSELPDKCYQA